jgi:hypothetical protein
LGFWEFGPFGIGFTKDANFYPITRLSNLNGKDVKGTSFNFKPFNFEVFDDNGKYLRHEGFEVCIC